LLARTFGMPLSTLVDVMSAEEFAMHWAAYRRRPWGAELEEITAAMIQATITRMAGKTMPEGVSVELSEFLPFTPKAPKPEPDPGLFAARVNAVQDYVQGAGRG
jgi:hypothetical protein